MSEPVDQDYRDYLELKGKKKHFCPDWDFMPIDESSPEFTACTCFGRVGGRHGKLSDT